MAALQGSAYHTTGYKEGLSPPNSGGGASGASAADAFALDAFSEPLGELRGAIYQRLPVLEWSIGGWINPYQRDALFTERQPHLAWLGRLFI